MIVYYFLDFFRFVILLRVLSVLFVKSCNIFCVVWPISAPETDQMYSS